MEMMNAYYENNREKCIAKAVAWNKNNPEKKRKIQNKVDWKKRGITDIDKAVSIKENSTFCYLCGSDGGKKGLHIDHCHQSGQVREMLCLKCNTGLGLFNDDVKLLSKAIEYLNNYKPLSINDTET